MEDLKNNFSIIPNKTLRVGPPNLVDLNLKIACIIGYIDGDGCLSKSNGNKICLSVTSSSLAILEWIKATLEEYFKDISKLINHPLKKYDALKSLVSIRKKKDENCYVLDIEGIVTFIVYKTLQSIPVPKLARKWQNPKIEEIYNNYITKNPHYFNNLPL